LNFIRWAIFLLLSAAVNGAESGLAHNRRICILKAQIPVGEQHKFTQIEAHSAFSTNRPTRPPSIPAEISADHFLPDRGRK
jgi:hypothetical protein